MASVEPLCAWEANTPLTSSYDGGGGMLLSILGPGGGVGGASILCRSNIIYHQKNITCLITLQH